MSDLHHDPANITNPEHHEHHIVGPSVYLTIYGTLLALTAITVAAAYVEMGALNPIVAVLIAVIKATVVILWFMHMKYQSKLLKLTIGAGVFTFLVLIAMTLSDYMSRAWGLW
ncbi:cytochrome C oxidase subunit IV family protein [Terriglobus sp. 2YAB30_2]|uniref:cytochrome C oxidase subunit IV family protein n=1 Tax=unclassified Terriglobus TaxID=2628988 RepID=UPI003F97C95C